MPQSAGPGPAPGPFRVFQATIREYGLSPGKGFDCPGEGRQCGTGRARGFDQSRWSAEMHVDEQHTLPTRVAVVGTGNVGATFAYTLLISGLAAEIVLIDANRARAEGEALDLAHATPFTHSTRIWAGDWPDVAGAVIAIVAAGANQAPGETRLDLLAKNAAIFRQIVLEIVRHNPGGIILIATNPVDLLTYETWRLTGLPSARVIGSGTVLDTARFRQLLSEHYAVDPRSVHA